MKVNKSILIIILSLLSSILADCNTIHGAGEDIEAGGKAISRAADKA